EQHAEPHVDQLTAGAPRRHRARRRDHRRQADRGGDAERKAEDEIEEGNEEHAAAEAEQGAERSRHGACGENDRGERGRDGRHQTVGNLRVCARYFVAFSIARDSASSLVAPSARANRAPGSTFAIVQWYTSPSR